MKCAGMDATNTIKAHDEMEVRILLTLEGNLSAIWNCLRASAIDSGEIEIAHGGPHCGAPGNAEGPRRGAGTLKPDRCRKGPTALPQRRHHFQLGPTSGKIGPWQP